MTQVEKQILFQDISARLPYGVMLSTPNGNKALLALVFDKKYNTIVEYNDYHGNENDINEWEGGDIEFVKPYLRPMSSMTNEENKKLDEIWLKRKIGEGADYLNSIHVDYRGLIDKGLALEAPDWMYK